MNVAEPGALAIARTHRLAVRRSSRCPVATWQDRAFLTYPDGEIDRARGSGYEWEGGGLVALAELTVSTDGGPTIDKPARGNWAASSRLRLAKPIWTSRALNATKKPMPRTAYTTVYSFMLSIGGARSPYPWFEHGTTGTHGLRSERWLARRVRQPVSATARPSRPSDPQPARIAWLDLRQDRSSRHVLSGLGARDQLVSMTAPYRC